MDRLPRAHSRDVPACHFLRLAPAVAASLMRRWLSAVPALSLVLVLGSITTFAQVTTTGIGPIVITVSELDRAVAFYTDVLSFR